METAKTRVPVLAGFLCLAVLGAGLVGLICLVAMRGDRGGVVDDEKVAAANNPFGPFDEADGEFTATDSGLKYRVTREGTGEKPTAADTVRVHYEGKLADGTVFDSSYQRGQPATFPLGGVIAGWTEGLQLVGEGGMIDLIIPPDIAYGARGQGPIPPNSTLYFTVELLKIMPAADAP